MTTPNREAYRTALAWLYALKNNDNEGLVALATDTHRNHARTVAAMTDMFLGLANISTNGEVVAYVVDSPPIDGFVPWIAVSVTDKYKTNDEWDAEASMFVSPHPSLGDAKAVAHARRRSASFSFSPTKPRNRTRAVRSSDARSPSWGRISTRLNPGASGVKPATLMNRM